MHRALLFFASGALFALSIILIVFGILFLRDVYLYRAEVALGSMILGIIMLLVGGGLLSTTIGETVRRLTMKR